MINSRSRLFAVFGDPISHSLSPLLQNYFFSKFNVNGVYVALRVRPQRLREAVAGAMAMNFAGINLTTPHKQEILSLCHHQSPEARLIGAANTLVFKDDKIHAFTTDAAGFLVSVRTHLARFSGSHVVLWGAGGAARSICFALSRLGVEKLTLVNRTALRGEELAAFCREHLAIKTVALLSPDHPELAESVTRAGILINATTMGMHPVTDAAPLMRFDLIGKHHFVYDLIYNPRLTRFLFEAEKRGAAIQNGLDMLIHQGLAALQIWMYTDYALDDRMYHEIVAKLSAELI